MVDDGACMYLLLYDESLFVLKAHYMILRFSLLSPVVALAEIDDEWYSTEFFFFLPMAMAADTVRAGDRQHGFTTSSNK